MNQLNTPQHEILRLIHEYIETYGEPPRRNNFWFEERLPPSYSGNYITNIKGELKQLKYIDDDLRLTNKGEEYVRLFFSPFTVRSAIVHV